MALNDDNRPSTRHHGEMTKWVAGRLRGASATAVSMLPVSAQWKKVFERKIFILNV